MKLKKATVRNYFIYLRNSIKLQRMMTKKKFSYEKSVNLILNDEYKDNLILIHYDDLEDTDPGSLTSSRVIRRPPVKNFQPGSGTRSNGKSSMKRVQNKNNIFDEESMDLGQLKEAEAEQEIKPKPVPRSRKRLSLKEINQEMRLKELQRKEQERSKAGVTPDDNPEKGLKNFLKVCKRIHFHMKVQLGLCIKIITQKFVLEDELKIGPIVLDVLQPVKQVGGRRE